MRKLVLFAVALAALFAVPTAANAAITDVFGGQIACATQTGTPATEGQRWCGSSSPRSTVKTFDDMPIDVNVAFPPAPPVGDDGPYPLVMIFHGYGGAKTGFNGMQHWLNKGYAVLSKTDRGFNQSCGAQASVDADPTGCADQYVRLMDTRYEVRDSQFLAAALADEDVVVPDKIAATGGSYGGGQSMALAALKNRTMMPDGTLVPWESPEGKDMSIAVALPNIPWTDLAYALAPNGSTVDYVKDNPYAGPLGIEKSSWVNTLYAGGNLTGRYAPVGTQPGNDLTGWKALLESNDSFIDNPAAEALLEEITSHHSSYYIDHSITPAPMLISNGFTDDLFPGDEAIRFYNRTRAQYPDSPLALFFGSFGHARGQNKSDTGAALSALQDDWIDYYLADEGTKPPSDVTAWTQTCPNPAPSVGYNAADWSSISPGEIRIEGGSAVQTVQADGGDPAVGRKFDGNALVSPSNTACTSAPGAQEVGTVNFEIAAPAGGFTMLGSPTIIAKIKQQGTDSQLAARLVDVAPDNTKTLVDRGLYRPEAAGSSNGFQLFQLHPNGWKFEEGHTARIELLPDDAGYSRTFAAQQPAEISFAEVRLPVVEEPGALGGLVKAPAKKVLPARAGTELARGYEAIGSETIADYAKRIEPPKVVGALTVIGNPIVKGKQMTVKVRCQIGNDSCSKTNLAFKGAPKKGKKGKGLLIAKGSAVASKPGQTKSVKLKLTNAARKFFKDKKVRKRGKKKTVRGPNSLRAKVTANGKSKGFVTVKRVGKVK